ncbi:MAG TPA: hypothetical protein VF601_04615 [Beijerinckiaceae bacterium]
MKTFALAVAAATLIAGPAFAQGGGNLGAQQPVHPGLQAPPYQQGSGQRAGGPANELNTNGPATTGTVLVPVQPGPSGVVGMEVAPGAPVTLDGKGQAAGGYVGEAKRRDGIQ